MATSLTHWLDFVKTRKEALDNATQQKDIIVCRGRYIKALIDTKKNFPSAIIPDTTSGRGDVSVESEIKYQLSLHQKQLNKSIKENKRSSDSSSDRILIETSLKFKSLLNRFNQIKYQNGPQALMGIIGDGLSFISTPLIKAPLTVSTYVLSTIGAITVQIITAPLEWITRSNVGLQIFDGAIYEKSKKDNTVVHKMSKSLKNSVKKTLLSLSDKVSRI